MGTSKRKISKVDQNYHQKENPVTYKAMKGHEAPHSNRLNSEEHSWYRHVRAQGKKRKTAV